MLATLINEVMFKMASIDKLVLQSFIKDLYDINFKPSKIETEKRFKDA